jgi:HlyD family secretion protein
MTDDQNNKQNISIEQLKQLMALQQSMQGKLGGSMPQNGLQQKSSVKKRMIHSITNIVNHSIHGMDSFIKFVIKKHDDHRSEVAQRARPPILFALYVTFFFLGVCGMWASFAPLDSASVAVGVLIPNSNRKVIQHKEGGIISKICVKEGDKVLTGDPLLELQDSQIKANYAITLNQYLLALANESRLIAEKDNLSTIIFSEFLLSFKQEPWVTTILENQENLFKTRKEVFEAEIKQSEEIIISTKARKEYAKKNLEFTDSRVKTYEKLDKEGYVKKSDLMDLKNRYAQAKASIAEADADVAKYNIEILKIRSKQISTILQELKETQIHVSEFKEKYNSASDLLSRVIIRSPVDGIVNSINFHTIGGVIHGPEKIMEIAPTNDYLIIEAKVPSRNIDSVVEGLPVNVRFSAFNSRSLPTFIGKVTRLSHDIVQEKNPGYGPQESHYIARIEVDMNEVDKTLKQLNLELHPGMQAEVQIITGTRTMLKYLLDPLKKSMSDSFKEK